MNVTDYVCSFKNVIFVVIIFTNEVMFLSPFVVLSVCLIAEVLKRLWMNLCEIFRKEKKQMFRFWG